MKVKAHRTCLQIVPPPVYCDSSFWGLNSGRERFPIWGGSHYASALSAQKCAPFLSISEKGYSPSLLLRPPILNGAHENPRNESEIVFYALRNHVLAERPVAKMLKDFFFKSSVKGAK